MDSELEEFQDYLSEFDNTPQFDNEACPVCGIDISSDIAPLVSYWVLLCSCTTDTAFDKVKNILNKNNIEFSFTSSKTSVIDYRIFIDKKLHEEAEKIISSLE